MLEIIETRDGSKTLYRSDIDETYHSRAGAIAESRHVFIKEGLAQISKNEINVLEIGFGTGLNALCVKEFLSVNPNKNVFFHTLEPYILTEEFYTKLDYAESFEFSNSQDFFLQIHKSDWNNICVVDSVFSLLKSNKTFQDISLEKNYYDVIFFDAFAPQKQSEMWSIEVLQKCYEVLSAEGLLVTYCAQGQFRRNLESVGFLAERLQGPPGKREMIRGIKK